MAYLHELMIDTIVDVLMNTKYDTERHLKTLSFNLHGKPASDGKIKQLMNMAATMNSSKRLLNDITERINEAEQKLLLHELKHCAQYNKHKRAARDELTIHVQRMQIDQDLLMISKAECGTCTYLEKSIKKCSPSVYLFEYTSELIYDKAEELRLAGEIAAQIEKMREFITKDE